MNRTRTLAAAFAAALLLMACGGGGDDPALPPNVTASGASIVSDDGKATLTVPAGAASAPQRVALAAAPQTQMPANASIVPGSVYRIEGDGGALAAPATLKNRDRDDVSRSESRRAPIASRRTAMRSLDRGAGEVRTDAPAATSTATASPTIPTTWRFALPARPAMARPRLVDLSKALGHVGCCAVPDGASVSLRDPEPRDSDAGRHFRRRAADRQRRGDRRAGAAGQGHRRRHVPAARRRERRQGRRPGRLLPRAPARGLCSSTSSSR